MNDFENKSNFFSEILKPYLGAISVERRPPLRFLAIMAFSIFIAEAFIMFLLLVLPPFSPLVEAFLDSLLLVVLLSPVLYLFLFRPLVQHITQRQQVEAELMELQRGLEQRITAHTHRLETVVTLNERLSAILDLEDLLVEVVNQIKERFGYYHAHIYLLDDKRERLVVAAGTGPAGAELKARGHSISLDASTSLVARAARLAEIVTVDNVRQAKDWLPNPLLPETYSEMAVPIILEGQVVGVLDAQEDEIAGLDEGDANLLRSLASQVAIAIRNARLFNEVETALAKAHAAQARYIEQAWQKAKIAHQGGKYHYARPDAPSLAEMTVTAAKQQGLLQDRPVVVTINSAGLDSQAGDENQQSIVAPITLQEKNIGAVQLHPANSNRTWTEDDLIIVKAVLDQLAQFAENLRLFEDTREQASRERIIHEVTDKLRAAPSLDILLETAARELGLQLGVRHTVLELGIDPPRDRLSRNNDDEIYR